MSSIDQSALRLQVIMLTLNAAGTLSAAVAPLRASGLDMDVDILICDGGSADGTVRLAEEMGLCVLRSEKGRGLQLSKGAEEALSGDDPDLMLFLHADSFLQPGWDKAVRDFADRTDRNEKAGYFRFTLDDGAASAARLESMVAWRCRQFGLPYGDQGLLLTPALYRKVGGYRAIPLMEDVDIVRRIGRSNMMPLDAAVVTSAARYRRSGYLRRSVRNLICLSLYFLGLPPRIIAKLYG
ncbi:glycosyltransferase [Hwanghaeella sp.]|uniref:glycosyltransferase n=1 Tax=Hwanghaeella sp. TaxID=2605943 RepID=UPI003CCC2C58